MQVMQAHSQVGNVSNVDIIDNEGKQSMQASMKVGKQVLQAIRQVGKQAMKALQTMFAMQASRQEGKKARRQAGKNAMQAMKDVVQTSLLLVLKCLKVTY